jgi:hypothetical protein
MFLVIYAVVSIVADKVAVALCGIGIKRGVGSNKPVHESLHRFAIQRFDTLHDHPSGATLETAHNKHLVEMFFVRSVSFGFNHFRNVNAFFKIFEFTSDVGFIDFYRSCHG